MAQAEAPNTLFVRPYLCLVLFSTLALDFAALLCDRKSTTLAMIDVSLYSYALPLNRCNIISNFCRSYKLVSLL